MLKIKYDYEKYLNELTDNEILNILKDYHLLCDIYKITKGIDIETKSREDIIQYLIDNLEKYLQMFITMLDTKDFNTLKNILDERKINMLNEQVLLNYLQEKKILFLKEDLEIPSDIFKIIKKAYKNKQLKKQQNANNRIYLISQGLVIAYGVMTKKILVDCLKEDSLAKINYYYKKNYHFENEIIIVNTLTNEERINKYLDNTLYKEFSNKELISLTLATYHHHFKSFKKLIKLLKANYIFKEQNIKFIDTEIIIPYLYNSTSAEEKSLADLTTKVIDLFEFDNDKLKNKIIAVIKNIKNDFPLWEYRGFSKNEV